MTSKELAKLLGISPAAVSLSLNNRPGVSQETRNKVREAALAHGILPYKHYASSKRSGSICLLYYYSRHLLETTFFRSTINGIEMSAGNHGYQVSSVNIYGTEQLEMKIKELNKEHIAGLIVFGFLLDQEAFNMLSFCQCPVLVMDNHFQSARIDFVCIDNVASTKLAVNYLINKRHCMPGYLHANIYTYDFEKRKQGFIEALRYNMMSTSNYICHEISPLMDQAEEDMLAIIDRGDQLAKSYFADRDDIAIGAMRAFKKRGFRIPEDVSFIGFDDTSVCGLVEPSLTSVHIPRTQLGSCAANTLFSAIDHAEHYPVTILFNGYIHTRNSIAPLAE